MAEPSRAGHPVDLGAVLGAEDIPRLFLLGLWDLEHLVGLRVVQAVSEVDFEAVLIAEGDEVLLEVASKIVEVTEVAEEV